MIALLIALSLCDVGHVEQQYLQEQRALLTVLQDDDLWNNPDRHDELMAHIDAATLLKSPALLPTLLPHLTRQRYKSKPVSRVPVDVLYPVLKVLVATGPAAVPALVERIKSVDFKPGLEEGGYLELGNQHGLALHALEAIYAPGGHGASLTKLQLELSAAKAEGVARERLLHAAQNPALLDRIKHGQ